MTSRSLTFRIVLFSLISPFLALMIAGSVMIFAFNQSSERSLGNQLSAYLDILIASTIIDKRGISLDLNSGMLDRIPRYWQVMDHTGTVIARSPLLQENLPLRRKDPSVPKTFTTQTGELLVFLQKTIFFPGNQKVIYSIGMPKAIADVALKAERTNFIKMLGIALLLLLLTLCALAFLAIKLLTSPLIFIRNALASIRSGEPYTLTPEVPKELAPLIEEINKLLAYGAAIIERHRTFAANLSHALKTPLTVLQNEAQQNSPTLAKQVQEKTRDLQFIIDRNLARIRTGGDIHMLNHRTEVSPIAEKITQQFGKLYQKEITVHADQEALFGGMEGDLYELLGNIIENACKYGHSQVCVTISHTDTNVLIAIEDDGPGIPADKRQEVLGRGVRLDEQRSGSGIGLAVATDIVLLYQGKLTLEDSLLLGGLKVELQLPFPTFTR